MGLLSQFATSFGAVLLAFIAQHYWHEFNKGDERRKRRRENLEKLAMLAFDQMEYLNKEVSLHAYDVPHDMPDPFATFWACQGLYFPELLNSVTQLLQLRLAHYGFVAEIKKQRMSEKIVDITQWQLDVYTPGLAHRIEFIAECRRMIEEDERWFANIWRRRSNTCAQHSNGYAARLTHSPAE
jgi:hypothetical protein